MDQVEPQVQQINMNFNLAGYISASPARECFWHPSCFSYLWTKTPVFTMVFPRALVTVSSYFKYGRGVLRGCCPGYLVSVVAHFVESVTHDFAISGAALVPLDRTLWKGIVVQGVVSQLVGKETCPQNMTEKVFKKCVRESLQEMRQESVARNMLDKCAQETCRRNVLKQHVQL